MSLRKIGHSVKSIGFIAGVALVLAMGAYTSTVQAAALPTYRFTKTTGTNNGVGYANTYDIAVDSAGNTYTSGGWHGTVTFDGVGGGDIRSSANDSVYITKRTSAGTHVWTKVFDATAASSSANPQGITVDKNNNVIVVGKWSGTVKFDGVGGSDSRTTTADSSSFITKYDASGNYLYTKTMATSGAGNYSQFSRVKTDSKGNIFVVGQWKGPVTFDGVGGGDSLASANDNSLLTKYAPNGTYIFTKVMDTSAASSLTGGSGGLAIDSSDNAYVAGAWVGTVKFNGFGGSDSRTSADVNAYVTKYSNNGSYIFTKTPAVSAGGNAGSSPVRVAVDKSDSFYLYSAWHGTATFDGVGGSDTKSSVSDAPFVTKYASAGTYIYTKVMNAVSASTVATKDITTDPEGHIYVSGYWTTGSVTFDGFGGTDTHATTGDGAGFVVQYNNDGTYGWSRTVDASGAGNDADNLSGYGSLAVSSDGDLYSTGAYQGSVMFDGAGNTDPSPVTTSPSGYVLSYHVYNPIVAPKTGLGIAPNHNLSVLLALSGTVLIIGGYVVYRRR
jgi:hypothetical protein